MRFLLQNFVYNENKSIQKTPIQNDFKQFCAKYNMKKNDSQTLGRYVMFTFKGVESKQKQTK